MFKPYAKGWAVYRKNYIHKVRKAPLVKEFEDEVFKHNVKAIHIDIVDRDKPELYKDVFVYSEGTPNFEHFICSKGAKYTHISTPGWKWNIGTLNPFKYEYKNYDIDSNILKFYKKCDNNKFNIVRIKPDFSKLPDTFDLFAMQDTNNSDLNIANDAMKYATNKKRHVVFASHPSAPNGSDDSAQKWWDVCKKQKLVSEYTHLVKGLDTNSLVEKSNRVFSSCSGVNFLSLINRKPTVSYRKLPWSEVSPVIKNATEEFTDWLPEEKDLLRFLSWYYHELSIDVTAKGWQEKLCKKLHT